MASAASPLAPARRLDRWRELTLLVFTQVGVPTWEFRRKVKARADNDDLIAAGTADKFEAAKAAALFEAEMHSSG